MPARLPNEILWERFWPKVTITGFCWEFSAHKTHDGYSRFWDGSRLVGAHRMAHELLVGEIPRGLVIDHLCRNRGCVNPDHFEIVTPVENTRRSYRASLTHCKRGHEFSEENTIVKRSGGRQCRECNRIFQRGTRSRQRAARMDERR